MSPESRPYTPAEPWADEDIAAMRAHAERWAHAERNSDLARWLATYDELREDFADLDFAAARLIADLQAQLAVAGELGEAQADANRGWEWAEELSIEGEHGPTCRVYIDPGKPCDCAWSNVLREYEAARDARVSLTPKTEETSSDE